MNEKELRKQISKEIENDLTMVLENVACLGRDAYGNYIDMMKKMILNKITFYQKSDE